MQLQKRGESSPLKEIDTRNSTASFDGLNVTRNYGTATLNYELTLYCRTLEYRSNKFAGMRNSLVSPEPPRPFAILQ